MNDDVFEGQWKQVKGHVREWWGKVTDDDVDRVNGKSEHLVGVLQERYGWTREHAKPVWRRAQAGRRSPSGCYELKVGTPPQPG